MGIDFAELTIQFSVIVFILLISGCIEEEIAVNTSENKIFGNISDTNFTLPGKITIDTVGTFDYYPREIETILKDIFQPGHFSIFDILVHLAQKGDIDMEFHFDEGMNTYVIDAINGKENWWYMTFYDGGWPEPNAFRMDHYPHKDKMYIRVIEEDPSSIERKYQVFREEIRRKDRNGGKVIIPEIVIDGPKTDERFQNVEVSAHDLRTDMFQPGVITAVDAIMSLADQGQLTCDLQWYDSIGSARFVRSYFVERIDEDQRAFRCGFVYEAGSSEFRGFRGNHIHLPPDTRVINSPAYGEWFWICI